MQVEGGGQADGVGLLHDGHRRATPEVGRDAVGDVDVEQIVERRGRVVEVGRVGDRAAAVGGLAVEGGVLVGVLAVGQVAQLLDHEGQSLREADVGDLVQVRRHLGVVSGHLGERLGRELLAELRRHRTALAQLLDETRVLLRVGDRSDPREVARGGGEERVAADVHHLDGFVDGYDPLAHLRGERLHVDRDDVDGGDPVLGELGEVLRHVPAGHDPGVDGGMVRLDHASEDRREVGQLRDRGDLDPIVGEVLTGPVGGVDLDPQREQLAGQWGDAGAVRDRQQGSQGSLPSIRPRPRRAEYTAAPRKAPEGARRCATLGP